MMDQVVHDPVTPVAVQVVNGVLNAVTVVLCAWLVNRRRLADAERKNGHCCQCEAATGGHRCESAPRGKSRPGMRS